MAVSIPVHEGNPGSYTMPSNPSNNTNPHTKLCSQTPTAKSVATSTPLCRKELFIEFTTQFYSTCEENFNFQKSNQLIKTAVHLLKEGG